MSSYHLTFDIDWAPDICIDYILGKLRKQKIKSTFFITHKTDIIDEIRKDGHNIGIHPNFLRGSTQGNSEFEIVRNLLNIVPDAKLMRSHSLYSSSVLFNKIFSQFSQLTMDLTLFTYKFPYVKRFIHHYENANVERINYNWEDDVAFNDRNFNWKKLILFGKINILNFHPIHIFLNSNNMKNYNNLRKKNNDKLQDLNYKAIEKYRNKLAGTETFLDNLINSNFKNIKLQSIK